MLNIQEQAIDTFNHALKFVSAYIPGANPADLKEVAKIYAINVTRKQKEAVYTVSQIDDYVPHKSIDFYQSVEALLNKM